MSLEAFRDNPWKEAHPAYEGCAFLHIRPAPEFATAEVVVSSLYRACGYESIDEDAVPQRGRELARRSQSREAHDRSGSQLDIGTWRVVIEGVLESPKQPNQSSRRFLQMCPLVPDVAIYSGSARLAGHSWNPGRLIARMICLGASDQNAATDLWRNLFQGLSVSPTDDMWARWLDQEFRLRRQGDTPWSLTTLPNEDGIPPEEKRLLSFPAKQFVRDMDGIIRAKPFMTRRQWVSLLESLVRMAAATHVLWLCDVNWLVWQKIRAILGSAEPPPEDAGRTLVSRRGHYLKYGNSAVSMIKEYASRYLIARIGINAILWQMAAMGEGVESINSCSELTSFLRRVAGVRGGLNASGVSHLILDLQEGDKNARTIACKKGIGSNLLEFARYVLGQRQTANDALRGYDQGYFLRKKAEYASAPWIVSMGPVATLAMVHCCLRDAAGPRSIQKLCNHLESYGIRVDRENVTDGELGKQLRMLGLVLDSPDAESGMLLMSPFDGTSSQRIVGRTA